MGDDPVAPVILGQLRSFNEEQLNFFAKLHARAFLTREFDLDGSEGLMSDKVVKIQPRGKSFFKSSASELHIAELLAQMRKMSEGSSDPHITVQERFEKLVIVYESKTGKTWLVDGNLRTVAFHRFGIKTIDCVLIDKSKIPRGISLEDIARALNDPQPKAKLGIKDLRDELKEKNSEESPELVANRYIERGWLVKQTAKRAINDFNNGQAFLSKFANNSDYGNDVAPLDWKSTAGEKYAKELVNDFSTPGCAPCDEHPKGVSARAGIAIRIHNQTLRNVSVFITKINGMRQDTIGKIFLLCSIEDSASKITDTENGIRELIATNLKKHRKIEGPRKILPVDHIDSIKDFHPASLFGG